MSNTENESQAGVETSAWTLGKIAEYLGADLLCGNPETPIYRLATLSNADEHSISFIANPKYRSHLQTTKASAVIVAEAWASEVSCAALVCGDPYGAYAKLSHAFDPAPQFSAMCHPSATISEGALVASSAYVGPNAVIETGAQIGERCVIGAGVYVGHGSKIGDDGVVHPNVVIAHGVSLGQRCCLQANVVLGGDGFGYAPQKPGWFKIAQIGGVVIGDDVEVGAGTTIDRGAIDDTLIGHGVILDNQIQIAHNVEIGDFTAIAGCVGIAGSTKIGKRCTVAGGAGIAGHLDIADDVHITMMAAISKSINEPGSYSSGTAMSKTSEWRKTAARLRRIESLVKRVAKLESLIK